MLLTGLIDRSSPGLCILSCHSFCGCLEHVSVDEDYWVESGRIPKPEAIDSVAPRSVPATLRAVTSSIELFAQKRFLVGRSL